MTTSLELKKLLLEFYQDMFDVSEDGEFDSEIQRRQAESDIVEEYADKLEGLL